MERIKAILPIFLAVFLCLSVSAVYAQGNEGYSEIYSAHLNGIPDSIVVEPGETVKVEIAFGYIAPASSRPEDRIGIIIGIDDSPRTYLLAGISYAEYLGGHDYVRTLDFGIPTEPGIYHIMSVSTKGYTTQGAEDLYRDYPDTRHIIGTIEVKDATSDESEEAYVKVQSVDLNGVYYSTKVEPGETIQVEVFFGYIAPTSPRPEDKVEIVIAFDYTPIGCLIEEIGIAEHLDGHDYVRTFEIIAPTEPGLYDLTYGYSEGCTCEQAKLLYNLANIIGEIEVVKGADDKEEGYAEIYSMSFNDIPHSITLEVEEVASPKVYFGYVAPASSRPEDQLEIVVGFEDSPERCLIKDIEFAEHLGGHNYVRSLRGCVFAETGTFHYESIIMKGYTCQDVKALYEKYPENRQTIGTIEVIEEESEECYRYNMGYVSSDYRSINYHIAICECDNNLRVELSLLDGYWLGDGSVSISVDEDIYVDYNKSKVSAVLYGSDEYSEIIPTPLTKWRRSSLQLIAGLIPGIGYGLSLVGYIDDITDRKNSVDKYAEDDLLKNSDYEPHEFFELKWISNDRDIVTIPWCVDIPVHAASAIRIDCPDMRFSESKIYDMAFRIDCFIEGEKVRLDVELPINFTATEEPLKKEW
jgi:hypothetical protein